MIRHACLASLVLLAPALHAQAPEERLDLGDLPGLAQSSFPQIAASGSSVYVAWQEERNGIEDVYFNRSLDGGRTWMPADLQLDSGVAYSAGPRIACSGSGVYVVWGDYRDGGSDVYFNRSLDGGETWLASDVRIDSSTPAGATWSPDPRIAAVGPHVYVCWGETETSAPTSNQTIRFRRTTDRGTTWDPEIRLDLGTSCPHSIFPEIAASGTGVYVLWRGVSIPSPFTVTDLFFSGSSDGGQTWLSSARRLDVGTPPGTDSVYGHSLAASGSKVYAAWEDGRFGDDVFLNRSLDGGDTWLAADVRMTSPSAEDPVGPQILASGDHVFLYWNEQYDHTVRWKGDHVFTRSLDSGATWSPTTLLNDGVAGVGYAQYSHMAVDGASLFFAWLDFRADPTNATFGGDVYFDRSRDSGTTWLAHDRLLDGGSWPYISFNRPHPRVAATGSSAYVTWSDARNGDGDVFFVLPLGCQLYGAGTSGSGGITPVLSGSGELSIGGSLTIEVSDGLGGALSVVAYTFAGSASIDSPFGTVLVKPPLT